MEGERLVKLLMKEQEAARENAELAALHREVGALGDEPLAGRKEEAERSSLDPALADGDDGDGGGAQLLVDRTLTP